MKAAEILHAARDLEKTGFSREQAQAVTRVVSELAETMATKADLARLDTEIDRLEANMATKADLARLETATKAEIARLETTMKSEISRVDVEIAALRRAIHSIVVPLMILNTAMVMGLAGMVLTGFSLGSSQ